MTTMIETLAVPSRLFLESFPGNPAFNSFELDSSVSELEDNYTRVPMNTRD